MSRLRAFRICKARYAKDAFTGDGSRAVSGRWHTKGTPIVYCAGSLAGAQLELLVNLQSSLTHAGFVYFELRFDAALIRKSYSSAELSQYLVDWRSPDRPALLQEVGDEWVRSMACAVMEVPSVVSPEDSNYLLNPLHPDFSRIEISPPKPVEWDKRLIARWS